MPTFAGELINAAVGVASLDDTALRGGYRVVADIAERDAIAGSDFDKTGCLVHVQSNGTTYERTATGWTLKSEPAQSVSNIYYATTGDDDTGDGTPGNPYATPQRCASTIQPESSGDFLIRPLDDGPFPAPQIVDLAPKGGGSINIVFTGNIDQTPTTTIPRPVTVAPVAGKFSQHTVTTNGYTDPVTSGSHFIIDGFSATIEEDIFAFAPAGVSLPSVSPDLNVVMRYGSVYAFGGYDPPVFPISTVFEVDGTSTPLGSANLNVSVTFMGIKFQDVSGVSIPDVRNCDMIACDHSGMTGEYISVVDGDVFAADGTIGCRGIEKTCFVGGVVGFVNPVGGGISLSECTIQKKGGVSQHFSFTGNATDLTVFKVDMENSSTYCIRADVGEHRINIAGGVSIDAAATVTTFMIAGEDASVSIKASGGNITGAVTNIGFRLDGPSFASGLGAGSSIVAGVADVTVGNAGNFAYGALPQNDFTAATGVGTVVRS